MWTVVDRAQLVKRSYWEFEWQCNTNDQTEEATETVMTSDVTEASAEDKPEVKSLCETIGVDRFSPTAKLFRVTAIVLRFTLNQKKKKR